MIESIEMVNWRAYTRREFQFQPGITFIMGANGTGKTSILEAIAYALTGEASTVKARGKLLRDPEKLATVRLQFSIDTHTYSIERSQSAKRAESARLTDLTSGKVLRTTHKKITERVEEILNVSVDFLRRIVYMAEGDIFRFLNDPPGDALHSQIQQVLGLTQLNGFSVALEQAQKEIGARIKATRRQIDFLEELGVTKEQELVDHMQRLEERRNRLLAELRATQSRVLEYERENEGLSRLAPLLRDVTRVFQEKQPDSATIFNQAIPELFRQREQELGQIQARLDTIEQDIAYLRGEYTAYNQLLDLLHAHESGEETIPCPVCSKPMTGAERSTVYRDLFRRLNQIDQQAREYEALLLQLNARRSSVESEVESLRPLRNYLAHAHLQSLPPDSAVAGLQEAIRMHELEARDHRAAMQNEIQSLEAEIAAIEQERARYLTAQSRLHDLGFTIPEEASYGLVQLEMRSLSIRAAIRAVQDTLMAQQNANMEKIYAQVAEVWNNFMRSENWGVQLDRTGMPVLRDGQEREADLSQLSGGEKTALMVMLHTIIAHHFSNTDFLLIDEPLEHLDSINRRSLIRFLVKAHQKGAFQQVIVTTFEESLIRKYMSDEAVHIVHLA
ncbi:MAG: AAA family ATPase [Ardenticatenaceae bacterium]|nr:AAA family ATPase [Ardenticatenaceae bacterium]HBY94182.1 hypothetical protein [Chloroflexota bacterium]